MSEQQLIIRDNRDEGLQVLLDGKDITDQLTHLTMTIDPPSGKNVILFMKPGAVAVKVTAEVSMSPEEEESPVLEKALRGGKHAKDQRAGA